MTAYVEIEGRVRRVEMPVGGLDGMLRCTVDGTVVVVDAAWLGEGVLSLIVEGRQWRCVLEGEAVVVGGGRVPCVSKDPRALVRRGRLGGGEDGPRAVRAPMAGRVVRVLVAAGEAVEERQGLVVIEAMKMQNELRSPKAGQVQRVMVQAGDAVAAGDLLALVE
jgi:biotin carboxyl carrier protein